MADRYGITGNGTIATGPSLAMPGAHGVVNSRARIYEMAWGSIGSPSDVSVDWQVFHADTALGTSTAVVAEALDQSAPTALTLAGEDYSVNPTLAAEALFRIGRNLRASWRWVAAPEGEILLAAVATESVVITPDGAAGGTVSGTMHFTE